MFNQGRRQAHLSQAALWWAYFGLGGHATPTQFAEFLAGTTHPGRRDHDLVAHALNEHLTELGLNSPIPYYEQWNASLGDR